VHAVLVAKFGGGRAGFEFLEVPDDRRSGEARNGVSSREK
jgi:hypothetical protein